MTTFWRQIEEHLTTGGSVQFDFGREINLFIAMVIATMKACAVMHWFMHLKFDTWINRIIFFSSFLFVFIFFIFTAIDVWTR